MKLLGSARDLPCMTRILNPDIESLVVQQREE